MIEHITIQSTYLSFYRLARFFCYRFFCLGGDMERVIRRRVPGSVLAGLTGVLVPALVLLLVIAYLPLFVVIVLHVELPPLAA